MQPLITGKNYIGNVLSSLGKKTFKTFNPQTNTENETVFYEANTIEIEKATILAKEAFKTYRFFTGKQKSNFLNEIANQILELGDALLETYCLESGLPKKRAIIERERTIFQLRSFANLVKKEKHLEPVIETANANRKPTPKVDLRKINIPLGTVAVFGASNFPLAYSTAGGDTASALASGCPVIVKSHPMHAGTGEMVASAIIKAAEITQMPNGVFSNLNSSGIKVGQKLVQNPMIKAVGFTGSVNGGRALFNLATERKEPIPVFAEMGSVNPVVLLPKALQNKAVFWANKYAKSITMGAGQFCTNPGLILGIKGKELTHFINTLAEEIVKINPSCMLHSSIKENFISKVEKVKQTKGVSLVANYNEKTKLNHAPQTIITVNGNTFLNNSQLHHEIFGPFSLVVQCKNKEELKVIIEKLEGQLTGTIIFEEEELKENSEIISTLQNRVGRMIFNGVSTGVEVCDSMVHGGPYPASTDSRFTAVGIYAIKRWLRPFSFQNCPNKLLPNALKNENPLKMKRIINGKRTSKKIEE